MSAIAQRDENNVPDHLLVLVHGIWARYNVSQEIIFYFNSVGVLNLKIVYILSASVPASGSTWKLR